MIFGAWRLALSIMILRFIHDALLSEVYSFLLLSGIPLCESTVYLLYLWAFGSSPVWGY